MADNYRMIQDAKERAATRDQEMRVYIDRDQVVKLEYPDDREVYRDGFRDYHGPRGDAISPN